MKTVQQGMSTLVFMLILLVAATMLTLMVAYNNHNEQRIFAADFQGQNAFAIAETAQAYAVAYMRAHNLDWNVQAAGMEQASIADMPLLASGAVDYTITIEMQRHISNPDIIRISTAVTRNQQRCHVTQAVRHSSGRLVIVPGSWRDFE